ncbi:MAG: hypothetical protein WC533_03435 [Candidatus Pacearchaeota archaeon]
MSLKEILCRNPNLTFRDFQELQEAYDQRFVTKKFSGFGKVRHTYAHIGKLVGRLAEYIHDVEEQRGENISAEDIRTKVIPDLLVYSVWLAEEFGVDIEQMYLSRFIGNLRRLHTKEISPTELKELEDCINKRHKINEIYQSK